MTDKYNDGLDNETVRQIVTTYRRVPSEKTKHIISDLGTLVSPGIDNNAVMYSDNLNLNLNMNTLQHDADNVAGCARNLPSEAFGQEVREEKKKDVGSTPIRDLSNELDIIQIEVQTGKMKVGERYKRMDVYISMMTIDDKLYSIKLTSDLTNAYSEIRRSCRKSKYWSDTVEELIKLKLCDLMIGRARYKQTKHRPLWQTKANLGNVLVVYCVENNVPMIILYLFTDDPICIPLTKELSNSQKKYYSLAGQYNKELPDL